MNINLREEETNDYILTFKNYLEDVQRINAQVNSALNEVMEQSKYDKLQKLVSNTIDVYTEMIVSQVETGVFAVWKESEGSLRSCLCHYRAGEAACEVCSQIEQHMSDLMAETLKIDKGELIVTERPIVSEADLEKLEAICQKARTDIADLKSQYTSQVETKMSDNDIYGTLPPLINGVSAKMEAFFEESLKEFTKLHEFVQEISLKLHNIAEENGVVGVNGVSSKGMDSASSGMAANENKELSFKGEKFSDENIKLFVIVVEKIVNQVGVDDLNEAVNKHYTALTNSRKVYSKSAKSGNARQHKTASKLYGRYTVTNKSIQLMEPVCERVNNIFEPIDKFYKEKFKSMSSGFDKANTIIHTLSSFLGLWGLGTWNLSKMISSEDSDHSILEKITLNGIALSSFTTAGQFMAGGSLLLKIMNWAMPFMKKSKTLVKLNEKVWDLTRQDIQIPYDQKWIDQYVMEHHELEYGVTKGQSSCFVYYHSVVAELSDRHQRRAFENAVFSAEFVLAHNYRMNTRNPREYRALSLGVFLNLVRSGMSSKEDMESKTSNAIVDKLYDKYLSTENITPRVDISPDNRVIG